ncbi:hypothetical protein TrVE_jg6051 [Triparma verrucosa]|uniref:Translation initiation factor eIF2B subunit delta n=1 Tax=Triparma verrucosa TaxID=1606542 RepID=A0A9W7FMM1_9STRA|nr:hypothetical protein TrVE_jg6051 [Triparma verrucosa]
MSTEEEKEAEKARKKAEKAKRAAEFAAKNPNGFTKPKEKLSKAERRAKQEAQRAAKANEADKSKSSSKNPKNPSSNVDIGSNNDPQASASRQVLSSSPQTLALPPPILNNSNGNSNRKQNTPPRKSSTSSNVPFSQPPSTLNAQSLFSHLSPPMKPPLTKTLSPPPQTSKSIHPSTVTLCNAYSRFSITGSNSRCIAMLECFKKIIGDYEPPKDKVMSMDLTRVLKENFKVITESRVHSISMGNAFTFLKNFVTKIKHNEETSVSKDNLLLAIDQFIEKTVQFASDVIAKEGSIKVKNGDVILTYGCSTSVKKLFAKALDQGKDFRVIVVDGRPELEGKKMLGYLQELGIHVTYVGYNSLSYVMKEVSLVLYGAAALLSNGSVVCRVGANGVTLVAGAYRKPVLVCCETYKFSKKVQIDAITHNELTPKPDEFKSSPCSDWVGVKYDVVGEGVAGIVTEFGIVPTTSVAVILREME